MRYRIFRKDFETDTGNKTVTCTMHVVVDMEIDMDLYVPKAYRCLPATVWEDPEHVRRVNRFAVSAATRCMPDDVFDEEKGCKYAYLKCIGKVCDEIARFVYLSSCLVIKSFSVHNNRLLGNRYASRWMFESRAIGVELPDRVDVDIDGKKIGCELEFSARDGVLYVSREEGVVALSADDMCEMRDAIEAGKVLGRVSVPDGCVMSGFPGEF